MVLPYMFVPFLSTWVKMLQYIYSHVDKHVTFVLSVDASDEQNTYTHTLLLAKA